MSPGTTVVPPTPPLFDEARLAVAGFLARYSGPTRKSYATDLRHTLPGAPRSNSTFSTPAGPTSSCGPGPWRIEACLGPPSAGGFPPSPASTASLSSTASSSTRRRSTSDGPRSTPSRPRSASTAWSWAHSSPRAPPPAWSPCPGVPARAAGVGSAQISTSSTLRSSGAIAPSPCWARAPSSPSSRYRPRWAEPSAWPLVRAPAGRSCAVPREIGSTARARLGLSARLAKRAGVTKHISPHSLRHSFITAALDAGRPAPRRADRRPSRRSADHHAVRPGSHQPRPPRQLHRHRLHRRGFVDQVVPKGGRERPARSIPGRPEERA